MATKQIGPIQFQGKLGNIVGRTTRKGYMSLGMKATKVTNPQTQKQVIQRVKFNCAQEYANGIPIDCFAGLRPYARSLKASVRNAASKLCFNKNLMTVSISTVTGDGRDVSTKIDPEKFFFSEGNEPGINYGEVSTETPQKAVVTVGVKAHKAGILHLIAYQADEHTFVHVTEPIVKDDTTEFIDVEATIPAPSAWLGMQVYVYAYTQYLPEDITVDYYAKFAAANSKEREAIESRSTYSPTKLAGKGTIS